MQIKVKKRLVYGAIAFMWIIFSMYITAMGLLSTDIVGGSCVPWGAHASYVAEKAITSSIFFIALVLPLALMTFCYSRVVYKLRHSVTIRQ